MSAVSKKAHGVTHFISLDSLRAHAQQMVYIGEPIDTENQKHICYGELEKSIVKIMKSSS